MGKKKRSNHSSARSSKTTTTTTASSSSAASNSSISNNISNNATITAATALLIEKLSGLKEEGNAAFTQKMYPQAVQAYTAGLQVLQQEQQQEQEAAATTTTSNNNNKVTAAQLVWLKQQHEPTLYSNRAMAFLKLEDFARAEADCNTCLQLALELDGLTATTTTLQQQRAAAAVAAKVWYRRALAREGLARQSHSTTTSSNQKTPQDWLLAAKEDLQHSLAAMAREGASGDQQDDMKRAIVTVAARIQRLLTEYNQRQERKKSRKKELVNGSTGPPSNRPSPEEQRLVVLKLLKSRAVHLQQLQHQQQLSDDNNPGNNSSSKGSNINSSNNHLAVVAMEGEAFFLVDWNWWSTWCHHVNFFPSHATNHDDHQSGSAQDRRRRQVQTQILSYLPPGASIPDRKVHHAHDDDSSSTESSSSSSNNGDQPPGPMDNRHLVLNFCEKITPQTPTRDVFVKHWYQVYRQQQLPLLARTDNDKENVATETIAAAAETATTAITLPALKPSLVRGHDYEVLPREVYSALRMWYGELNTCPSLCYRTSPAASGTNQRNGDRNNSAAAAAPLVLSLYPGVQDAAVRNAIATASPAGMAQHYCEACGAPHATSKCQRCKIVRYCSRGCQESNWPLHRLECKEPVDNEPGSGDDEQNQQSDDRHYHRIRRGRVGLNNLGNTCFMNSALQSLSHAAPLTRYFLSGRFRADLNQGNPLGTGGKLANAYDVVMKDLWMRKGSTSTSPTALKRAIALFAPRFAGCLQHDAQEFLAYLLDGLHEDLNRIRKAPYVEMPEMTDGQNMAVAAARAWEAHRRRNDSLVLDTFYGQFKSTCVCPKCNRVSVSFDAFNHVSLEIPPQAVNAIMPVSVLVFPALPAEGAAPKPVRYGVEIRRNCPIMELRQQLATLTCIPGDRLVLCEVFDHAIVDTLRLNRPVSDIRPDDLIVAYEVDPFTNATMHLLVTNKLVTGGASTDAELVGMHLFGFPFMASFPAQWTCREIWDYIWRRVAPMVAVDGVEGPADRQLLEIRLHNGRGKSVLAFPLETDETKSSEEEDDNVAIAKTAYLPADSDEQLTTFLGSDATEQFIFISLDWSESAVDTETDDETEPVLRIDENNFLAYENHPSWIDVAQRLKASAGSHAVNLDQCFEAFTKPERLDEHNMWYCSSCQEHVQAMKTMELWRLPNVLIVHLKRFEFKHALRRDKLDTLVNFPLDGLDMSRHCASMSSNAFVDDSIPAMYDLFAVTNHYGRMGFGHYTAFARSWDESSLSEDWNLFDDSSVRSEPSSSIVSPAAYVLFYRRRVFH